MDKIAKEKIKNLKAKKEYDEIFRQFGRKTYKRVVPSKYRKQDLKKLKKEGKYEDIFNKYGKTEYNKLLVTAMYREIKDARGFGAAAAWRTKEFMKSALQKLGLYSVVLSLSFSGAMAISSEMSTSENGEIYKDEIQAYNDKIENYANEVNRYAFSDIQIFSKVMDDMWKGIKGYAEPEKDIHGYLELDLATEEGFGVCRNMASDIAKKLNEINPKYNARVMAARMGEDGYYEIANINRTVLETNETVADNETASEEQSEETSELQAAFSNLVGNHMVTLVDVPEDNLILVLDPTNPGIGVYINGKIIMLNSAKENGIKYEAKEYVTAIFNRGGIDGIIDVASDYMRSFQKPNLSFEEIQVKYGLEAQNLALQEVRDRVVINEAVDLATKESEKQKNEFDERYKVGKVQPINQSKSDRSSEIDREIELN